MKADPFSNNQRTNAKIILSFLSFAAVVYILYATNSAYEALIFLSTLVIHEAAHLLCAKLLKIKNRFGGAGILGLYIYMQNDAYSKKSAIMYMAGIAANILFAAVIYVISCYTEIKQSELIIFYNLTFAAVNLIPSYPTDGARALTSLLCIKHSSIAAVNTVCMISEVIALAAFIGGFYIFIFVSDNLLLAVFSCLILFSVKKEKNAVTMSYLKENLHNGN